MGGSTFTLAGDFRAMDYQQWRELADEALQGAPFEKLLTDVRGLTVQPLYTASDGRGPVHGWPGYFPYVRGTRPDRPPWAIQQVYRHPDLDAVNRAVLADLTHGVSAVELELDGAARAGRDLTVHAPQGNGVAFASVADLAAALTGVHDDLAPVGLDAGAAGPGAAALMLALWSARGRDPKSYRGWLNLDPVAAWVRENAPVERGLRALADVAAHVHAAWPQARSARIDTSPYHDAGAAERDELGVLLATGVAYLEAMTGAGLSVVDAARQIVLRVPLDADLFLGIAKLRAARLTWARVLEASGASDAIRDVRIEATTSRVMMTRRDPWVNMLRTTVVCFSGAVGGADAIHVRPFDEAIGLPDELSLRVARNTQAILHEECHLDQVIDPAAGSWYVDQLTAALAEAAWADLQAIQADGGVVAALTSGRVLDRIDTTWLAREKDLARRKEPITGVSEFPNLGEKAIPDRRPERLEPRPGRARPSDVSWPGDLAPGEATRRAAEAAAAGATLDQLLAAWEGAFASTPAVAKLPRALPARPRAGAFEALRDASDRHLATTGQRPRVLLAKLGPVSEHTARVTYARSFFEAGGIEAVDADRLDGPDAAAALVKAHPEVRLAVLCGDDARYAAEVPAMAESMKGAGLRRLYLAGRAKEHEAAFRAAGVDELIHIGVDVRDALERAHLELQTPFQTTTGDRR